MSIYLYVAYVIFGLVAIWFSSIWYIEKIGLSAFKRNLDNYGASFPIVFTILFTIVSLGLLWPTILITIGLANRTKNF